MIYNICRWRKIINIVILLLFTSIFIVSLLTLHNSRTIQIITHENSTQAPINVDIVLNETKYSSSNIGLFPEDLADIYSTDRIFEQINFRPTPLNRTVLIYLARSEGDKVRGSVK
jgi:hypothetical protein